jgi:hypothetical protein
MLREGCRSSTRVYVQPLDIVLYVQEAEWRYANTQSTISISSCVVFCRAVAQRRPSPGRCCARMPLSDADPLFWLLGLQVVCRPPLPLRARTARW